MARPVLSRGRMQVDFMWLLAAWVLGGLASGWLVGAWRER